MAARFFIDGSFPIFRGYRPDMVLDNGISEHDIAMSASSHLYSSGLLSI